MRKRKLVLKDPDAPETPEELAKKVKALKSLVEGANAKPTVEPGASNDDPASTPLAIALGLTPGEAEMARALGFL